MKRFGPTGHHEGTKKRREAKGNGAGVSRCRVGRLVRYKAETIRTLAGAGWGKGEIDRLLARLAIGLAVANDFAFDDGDALSARAGAVLLADDRANATLLADHFAQLPRLPP